MPDGLTHSDLQTRRLLFHVHTRHSLDAWVTPRQIIDTASQSGLDLVFVTDHDTHLGSVECALQVQNRGLSFPMGAEYRSHDGDMIAVFLSRPITTRDALGIIEETRAQGGLVVLPHPFKGSRFNDRVFEACDLIEVFNARTSESLNQQALQVAEQLGKPTIAGADAHWVGELGLVICEFEAAPETSWRDVLLSAPRRFQTAHTTLRSIRSTQILKACRQFRPILFAKNVIRWAQASSGQTP